MLGIKLTEYDMNGTESSARFEELFTEMFSESDRGCILIGASVLDDILSSLLQKHLGRNSHVIKNAMEPLFAGMGPLSSFSARIKIAYCLGLIKQWEFEDMERVRKIRNKAAHEYTAKTFTNNEIIQITQQLKGADHAVTAMESKRIESDQIVKQKGVAKGQAISKERLRFQLTVVYMAGRFDVLCQYTVAHT